MRKGILCLIAALLLGSAFALTTDSGNAGNNQPDGRRTMWAG